MCANARHLAQVAAHAPRGAGLRHGRYAVVGQRARQAGTMYPIPMRLADRGQVETAWEQDPPRGRPPRHLYRLSPAGAELVADLRAERPAAARSPRPAIGT